MIKYNIVFVTDGLPVNGNTINERGLGGSESALIYVSREMARLGHKVRVFCNCDMPGIYDGVLYQSNKHINNFLRFDECDILIVSRHYGFLGGKFNSKLNILWNHDIMAEPDKLAQTQWNIDFMWCLSEFHKQDYIDKLPDIEPIIKLAANGFDPDIIPVQDTLLKKHQIMFTSRPERGLYKALELYERLNDKTLRFLICNYATFDTEMVRAVEQQCYAKIDQLIRDGFEIRVERFKKEDLYKHIAESKAVFYPTDFPEIFCISAIEAQACGTAFIHPHRFALTEVVGYDGLPIGFTEDDFDAVMLERLRVFTTEPDVRINFEIEGIKYVQKYTWPNVVKNMITDIDEYLRERSKDTESIIRKLYYESDLFCARKLAKKEGLNKHVEQLDHFLRFVNGEENYNEIYENEDTHEKAEFDIEEASMNPRFHWLDKMIKKHKIGTLLDYACHSGSASFWAKMHNPDLKITGYDISKKAIESAKNRLENQFPEYKNDISFSNIEPETQYDAVLLGEVLEHVKDPQTFVEHIENNFLKPGGTILITLPRGGWEHLTRCKNKANPVQYHVHSFDYADVEHIFGREKEFSIETTFFAEGYCGEPIGHYMIDYISTNAVKPNFNYNRKWLLTRPYQSITACIIARDAEKTIEKTLDNIYEHMDAIDIAFDHEPCETKEIIRRLNKYDKNKKISFRHMPQRIVADRWGFANARNFSMEKAETKWIFWIDTDETFIFDDYLRRYLDHTHINALAIPQHHQMLDAFIKADLPNRLFRTGTGKFYGYIHEQAMSIDDINEPIKPSLTLTSAHILNMGEITERQRKQKALGRNLVLLQKDAEVNVDMARKAGQPIRKLTPILIMRDMVNRMKWGFEKFGTYQTRDALEHCLPRILKLWDRFYKDEEETLYYNEAKTHLRDALILTGQGRLYELKSGNNTKVLIIRNSEIEKFEKEMDRIY